MENLTAYLKSNRIATHFSIELKNLIMHLHFNSLDFYSIFQVTFQAAYKKFKLHILNHSTCSLFCATRLFDPKYIHIENNTQ